MDFNLRLNAVICELLGLDVEVEEISKDAVETYKNDITDIRCLAESKNIVNININSKPYYQVFAQRNGFIPNLSIIDLLFNMGPEGLIVLKGQNF